MNVNGDLSQTAEAINGVPQGPVIGPKLAIISDLPDHLAAGSLLYADDVKFIVPHNCHEFFQNSLNAQVGPKVGS